LDLGKNDVDQRKIGEDRTAIISGGRRVKAFQNFRSTVRLLNCKNWVKDNRWALYLL